MHSCIYNGWVRHRRHEPTPHAFRYRLFMMYLDLDELPTLFDGVWGWSTRRPALARFRREDYHGDPALSLQDAVRATVERHTGRRPLGPIRMLTHLRYFGHVFNPVTFYYCFTADGKHVETIVAEITNTPWNERHAYVLPQDAGRRLRFEFDKGFHVSPFMPSDMRYDWRFSTPNDVLVVHMNNVRANERTFDATLSLEREDISGRSLARALIGFPLMTLRVMSAIYWQALRLWLKRTPFFVHPHRSPKTPITTIPKSS